MFYAKQQLYTYIDQPFQIEHRQLIEVKRGISLQRLLVQFEQQEWIKASPFSKLLRYLHPELLQLKAGTFQIQPNLNLKQVLELLVSGKEHQFSITFVEGSTFKQLRESLAQAKGLSHTIDSLSEQEIAQQLGIKREKLEGLFLSETFYFTAGTSDLDILARSHAQLQQTLDHHWEKRAKQLPLKSAYEALILASIIEKETAIEAERGFVSSVFINRLNRRMRLQTDPTVIYGMGDNYRGRIRKKDLQTPTPYNTYTIFGLPPTPIAMVGEASIIAALNPVSSNYLYFVATGKGGHKFSTNLKDHNRAVQDYLKVIRANK